MTPYKTVSLEVPAELARQLSHESLYRTLSLFIKSEKGILGILEVSELCKVGELPESYEFPSSLHGGNVPFLRKQLPNSHMPTHTGGEGSFCVCLYRVL